MGEAAQYQTVEVFAKDEFKYDIELTSMRMFDSAVPDFMDVQEGDWLRFTLNENPSTGYWWETNAATEAFPERHNGAVREIFNYYQRPQNNGMLGASGKRIIVIEILEDAEEFSLRLRKAGNGEGNEDLPNKTISLAPKVEDEDEFVVIEEPEDDDSEEESEAEETEAEEVEAEETEEEAEEEETKDEDKEEEQKPSWWSDWFTQN